MARKAKPFIERTDKQLGDVITTAELAGWMQISPQKVRQMVYGEEIPYFRLGGENGDLRLNVRGGTGKIETVDVPCLALHRSPARVGLFLFHHSSLKSLSADCSILDKRFNIGATVHHSPPSNFNEW